LPKKPVAWHSSIRREKQEKQKKKITIRKDEKRTENGVKMLSIKQKGKSGQTNSRRAQLPKFSPNLSKPITQTKRYEKREKVEEK
jgi:hypothetical protein